MKLFHGTSASNARAILESGELRSPYLTSCEEQADYYAECAADETEDAAVIFELEVPDNLLEVDFNAYAEPLTYFRNQWASSEEEWHEKIDCGEIPYPDHHRDIGTALKVTRSLKTSVNISLEHLLNREEILGILGTQWIEDPSPGP